MNLTYIIGNGFDLGLGLKTSYNAFIEKYIERPADGLPRFVSFTKRMLRDRIAKDAETWADAEIAFAGLDFSDMLGDSDDKPAKIIQLQYEFKKELAEYLFQEQRKFCPINDLRTTSNCFKERIVKSVYEGMSKLTADKKFQLVPSTENNYVHAINFNYTYTFDYLFRGGSSGSYDIPFVCNLNDGTESG